MDKFCGSQFWDSNLTWYTEDPHFTRCFERTVLVWIPCVFLWLFSGLEAFYIANSKNRNVPWNFLNVSKVTITSCLIILTIMDLTAAIKNKNRENAIYMVDIVSSSIKIFSFILSTVLVYYNKKHGLRCSGLLFLFWLLMLLCGMPQFRTEILESQRDVSQSSYQLGYLIYYPLVVLMFFLNCFADKSPRETRYSKTKNPWPEESSGFLSRLTFNWFNSLIWKGFRTPLEVSDLWDMKHENKSKEIVPLFEKYWQESLKKSGRSDHYPQVSNRDGIRGMDFDNSSKKEKTVSVLPAIAKTFGLIFLFGALLKFLEDILVFVGPQILSLLISFVESEEPQWKGFFYVGLLFSTTTVQTIISNQYYFKMYTVGMKIRTVLISAIYKKALCISNSAKREATIGEIVNLMSVDVQNVLEITPYVHTIWSAPLQIILAVFLLWRILGPSALAGLAVMIIMIPINGVVTNKQANLQIKQMKNKDERVKLMNEILNGIKVLKLYAWEPSFETQILKVRGKENKVLKLAAYLNASVNFIWSCAPFLVSLVSFATFVLVDEKNVLDAQIAFVSLSLFNVLRVPLNMLPLIISYSMQAWISIKRINKFMNTTEVDPNNVQHEPTEKIPLVMENGTFDWGKEPVLKKISLRIEESELAAVVGPIGSGKSSLISAFLGEMNKTSGRVNTVGSIAYVPQQAWIQNATLQDNILFGKPLNKKFYDAVIEACALKPDLKMLAAGDRTEIGEKGINLSGGQKQRISLARAVYAKADIYFLDDPLSAVDSHVGKHIFENVIGPTGLLKNKTRVLVTHSITYLHEVNKIVVLKDGEISEIGTYQELLDRKGAFADFLLQHSTEVLENEEMDESKGSLGEISTPEKINNKFSHNSSQTEPTLYYSNDVLLQWSIDSGILRNRSLSSEALKKKKEDMIGEKLIEEERAETGNVKWTVYKQYLKSVGVFLSAATIAMNIISQSFNVTSNIWLSSWSQDDKIVVNGTTDAARRDMYLGVYGVLGIGQAVSSVLASISVALGCWFAARAMHDILLKGVFRAPLAFFDTTPIGRILSRFSKDVEIMDVHLPLLISDGLYCLFQVLGILFVISFTTPIFLAAVVPIGVVYYFIQKFYIATSRQLKRLESVTRSPIYSHFGETIAGISCIRAYKEQKRFINESEAKVDLNQMCYCPNNIAMRWLGVRLEMIANVIILFAALFAVIGKNENPGLVGLSITYSLEITQMLNWLVRSASEVETNIVAVERIKEYAETPQEASWRIPNKAPPQSWPDAGTVIFKDYAVRYRPGLDLVLKSINFFVRGGEKIGIVGRTGAGKSSLTVALFRIIEAAGGEILLDNINIAGIGLHDLRSRLTIIPQDAVLFSGSLRMNLDPFEKNSDEEVWRSLEHAHLKKFVRGLPTGLHHEVTEGGENLSVGQRQLICLSRALLRKTKILILDEATAAVDLETDDLIQQTIRTEFKDCTVLTIAHRLNTIMDSDRVMVLDKGRVVEFDTPENLLSNKESIFYAMARDAGLI